MSEYVALGWRIGPWSEVPVGLDWSRPIHLARVTRIDEGSVTIDAQPFGLPPYTPTSPDPARFDTEPE